MNPFRLTAISALLILSLGSASAQDEPNEKRITLGVNLHCNSCKQRIERDIAFERGVRAVVANLATNQVTIAYNPQRNTSANLIRAIERLGYTVAVADTAGAAQPAKPKGPPAPR